MNYLKTWVVGVLSLFLVLNLAAFLFCCALLFRYYFIAWPSYALFIAHVEKTQYLFNFGSLGAELDVIVTLLCLFSSCNARCILGIVFNLQLSEHSHI